MNFLIKPIMKFPFATVCFMAILTLFFGYNLKNLKIDEDLRNVIPETHPVRVQMDEIENEFGTIEMMMVGLETDTIYNSAFLKKIYSLSKKLKKLKIESDPFVDPQTGGKTTRMKRCIAKVKSLSTVSYIEGDENGMIAEDLMERVPENSAEMERLKEKISSWDMYVGNLVSEDSTSTLIGVEYKKSLSFEEMIRMVEKVIATIDGMNFGDDVSIYYAGQPFLCRTVNIYMKADNMKLLPAVFGVIILFLLFSIRRISSVMLIFLTIGLSVMWTMGLIALMGFPIEILTSSIPVLLVAIASADCIHILCHYSYERAEGQNAVTAVENTIRIIGVSIFATSLTTMAGFMSLMTSKMPMIYNFGLFAGIGIGVAFIVSVIFIPALLIVLDRMGKEWKRTGKSGQGINLVPFFQALSQKMMKNSNLVYVSAFLIVAIAIAFSLRVYPDMNPVNTFKKDSEIRQAEELLNKRFAGMTTTVLCLDSAEDGYFKTPAALKKLDSFKSYLEQDPQVGRVETLAAYIKRMNYAMNENNVAYDVIPDTKEMIAQYLLIFSDPEALENVVTFDFSKARLVIHMQDGCVSTIERINTITGEWMKKEFPEITITKGGSSQIALAANSELVLGQIKSLGFSVIIVFMIAAIIFRSFTGGLFAVVPLSISVIIYFGLLGLLRIPLDISTSLTACIAIGIGADYPIHFINSVKHGAVSGGIENGINEGMKISGNAIVFNALSVALGFLVMVFSAFLSLLKLGTFISITMTTASLGTMLLLPELINTFKPAFLQQKQDF